MGDNAIINQFRPLLKSWTPTFPTQGLGTWTTTTLNNASYFMLGRLCFWELDVLGTLDIVDSFITHSLPVQPISDSGFNFSAVGNLVVAGIYTAGGSYYNTNTGVVYGRVIRPTGTTFPVTPNAIRIVVGGIFLAAETA